MTPSYNKTSVNGHLLITVIFWGTIECYGKITLSLEIAVLLNYGHISLKKGKKWENIGKKREKKGRN